MKIMKVSYVLLLSALQLFQVVESNEGMKLNIHWKLVNSFLSNGHLPVWVVYEENPTDLKRLEYIMSDIGPITAYQDPNRCAAALYFQNREQLDGTIDQRCAMKNYNPQINPGLVEGINLFTSARLMHPAEHRDLTTGISADEVALKHGKHWEYVASRIEDPDVVYVETLVVVNYDVLTAFANNYKALITNILVTFNSVDMLYSKIDDPKIKINIAGIIIGTARKSFPTIEKHCYKLLTKTKREAVEVTCVNRAMKWELGNYAKKIFVNAYDVVVFFTKFDLYGIKFNANGEEVPNFLNGYADHDFRDEYIGFTVKSADIKICTIQHLLNFQHFSIVAHEMAHLFDVTHDPGQFRSSNKQCIGNLMRAPGSLCEKCVYFADTSIQQMKRFFGSREGCKFRNEPHSLHDPSKPQLFWNEHKQCQCYGFLMAKKPQKINCGDNRLLQCSDDAGNTMETDFFMDGTLCNKHKYDRKVCWHGKCRRIGN